jgi:hypothetical protein
MPELAPVTRTDFCSADSAAENDPQAKSATIKTVVRFMSAPSSLWASVR